MLETVHPLEATVLIGTRNRGPQLTVTLEAFEAIRTSRAWELIVIDNRSTDNTEAVLRSFAGRQSLPLRYIKEVKPGVCAARNAGLRAAGGKIVLITDDDCYPQRDWIDAWLDIFESSPLAWGCGRVELFDLTDLPVTIKTDAFAEDYPPFGYIPPGKIHSANCAFRREVLKALGGFDERLGPGSRFYAADDSDLFQRASDAGFRGGYRPGPAVAHHHGRKLPELRRLQRDYAFSAGAFYAKTLLRGRGGAMISYFLNWYHDVHSPVRAMKLIYWSQRKDFRRRNWHVLQGFLRYTAAELFGRRAR
ncbi:MAG: glycosyltransferase family 2 protein [Acetobacteraceae bacterium]|nr:glycosyltransferase family 2 protein [Acetobacteraceae bacterium]